MATNLALDDKLIEEAVILGGHKSKKDAVNSALREYIQLRKQRELIQLFHKIDFDPAYSYKKGRLKR